MNINHIVGTKKKTTKDISVNESSWEEVESHENVKMMKYMKMMRAIMNLCCSQNFNQLPSST